MEIDIRPLRAMDEYRACEALQRRVWRMPDDLDVVPLHLLLSAQRNGAIVLGAFDGERLVGFVFGYAGLTGEGTLKHCSHMMGVDAEYQSSGVGFRLKSAQREAVLAQGFDLVTWTYDPLESRNARLNISKLGCVCGTYIPDFYGPMSDGLNAGLPSDRFQVDWWIAGERVRRVLAGEAARPQGAEKAQAVHIPGRSAKGFLTPGRMTLDRGPAEVAVEIPPDIQAIRASEPGLAAEWRMATREVFEFYFGAGLEVVDFSAGRYVLARGGRQDLQD